MFKTKRTKQLERLLSEVEAEIKAAIDFFPAYDHKYKSPIIFNCSKRILKRLSRNIEKEKNYAK